MLHTALLLPLAPALAFLFWKIAREDAATGKVRNALLLRGFALLGFALLALGLQSLAAAGGEAALGPALPPAFFSGWLRHTLTAFLAGFLLWRGGTWPAGDAKLYILAAAALPLLQPGAAYFPSLLFLALLVNILVPAGLLFALQKAAQELRALPAGGAGAALAGATALAKQALDPGRAAAFLAMTALFGAVRALPPGALYGLGGNEPAFFALMLVAWPPAGKLITAGGRWSLGLLAAAAAAAFFTERGPALLGLAALGVTRSLPFLVLFQALDAMMRRERPGELAPAELAQGTVLSDGYLERVRAAAPEFYAGQLADRYPDGLTAEQAQALRGLIEKEQPSLAPVGTRETRPFAGWIAAGAALTLAFHGETLVAAARFLAVRL